jgi:hypothetical protein
MFLLSLYTDDVKEDDNFFICVENEQIVNYRTRKILIDVRLVPYALAWD